MKRFRKLGLVLAALTMTVGLGACGKINSALNHNQQIEQNQERLYNTNQPLPVFPYSQLRQTAIDVETAQAEGAPSTTFMMPDNWYPGVHPWYQCPSVGFPVHATDQISNPDQLARTGGNNSVEGVIPQIDPNGIYSGNSTGTYSLCLNTHGQKYGAYWEGFALTLTGNAAWDQATGTITDVTNPTGQFNTLTPAQQEAVNQAAIGAYQHTGQYSTTPTSAKP